MYKPITALVFILIKILILDQVESAILLQENTNETVKHLHKVKIIRREEFR